MQINSTGFSILQRNSNPSPLPLRSQTLLFFGSLFSGVLTDFNLHWSKSKVEQKNTVDGPNMLLTKEER